MIGYGSGNGSAENDRVGSGRVRAGKQRVCKCRRYQMYVHVQCTYETVRLGTSPAITDYIVLAHSEHFCSCIASAQTLRRSCPINLQLQSVELTTPSCSSFHLSKQGRQPTMYRQRSHMIGGCFATCSQMQQVKQAIADSRIRPETFPIQLHSGGRVKSTAILRLLP